MIIENLDAFKVWLSKTLDPICDADPSTLSRYVLALVKKEKPENELKDICIDQLDVFLQTKTKAFVETLFTALKSKSYLLSVAPEVTNTPPPPAVTQVPVTTINTIQPRTSENDKRKDRPEKQLSDDGNRESKRRRSRSPSPRPRGRDMRDDRRRRYDRSRYSPDRRYGRRRSRTPSPRRRDRRSPDRGRGRSRSRSPRTRSRSRSRSWSRNRSRSRSRSKGRQPDSRGSTPTLDNGRYSTASAIPTIQSVASSITHSDKQGEATPPVPPGARPRCRDYDEKGFCMRGDLCPFDHGLDPVVVEDISIPNMSIPPPSLGGPPPTTGPSTGPRPPPPGPGPRGGLPPGPPPPPRVPSGPGGPQFPPPGTGGPPPPPPPGTIGPRHIPPLPPRQGPDVTGEGYNPEAPALTSVPPPGYWSQHGPRQSAPYFNPQTGRTRDLVQVPTLPESPPRDMPEDKMEMSESPSAPIVSSRVVVPQKRPHSMMDDIRPFMGRGRGRGRGYMSPGKKPFDYGRLGGFRRMNNENATLEVRKIPQESNNIAKLNEHFGKFGTLVNVQICFQGDPEGALVTFSSNAEAHAAYKSSEPVFNNRFIKVFWHKKEEEKPAQVETDPEVLKAQYKEKHELQQQENLKQKVLVTFSTAPEILPTPEQLRIPARARLGVPPANKLQLNNSATKSPESPVEKGIVYTSSVGNLKKTVFNAEALRQNKSSLCSPTAVKTADFVAKIEAIKKGEELKKEAAKKRLEIQQQKQELLKKQIEQQKKLIEKLEKNKTMSAEDKSAIMTTLKALSSSIDKLKLELLPKMSGTVPQHKSPEQTRKEILDTELELMTKSGNGEDTTLLKKKLLELTKEASALGLLGGRGRGRGRGRGLATRGHMSRGRGTWISRGRGRGGSLTLDKRPRTLQIRGFDLEEKDEIKVFFSQTCAIEKLDYNESIPSAIITFSTRKDAEKAIGRGGKFKKPLTIQWHTPLLRTVSVVSDDSLSGALDDDEDSQVDDDLDESGLLGGDDEEEEDEESRSWRR